MTGGRRISLVVLIPSLALPTGCASTLYDWGSYELSIYSLYSHEADLHREIERLSREVEQTRDTGRIVPPGKLAHIGYLHSLVGEMDAAVRSFEAERAAFPESEVFMDFLIAKVSRKPPESEGEP